MEAGIYEAVNPDALKKIRDEHGARIADAKSRGIAWAGHKADYTKLVDRLDTLADKTEHDVMVPFGGKKAFFEGRLVHTNEIMVLLGDNWFVERSAKQAAEIAGRRLSRCDEMLAKIDDEIRLYESWLKQADELAVDTEAGEANIEIREPFDEKFEAEWKKRHRENLKRSRASEKLSTKVDTDDDDLWRRLDELEIEEELDEHLLHQNALHDVHGADTSESSYTTDTESDTESDTSDTSKKVSFGQVDERLFSSQQEAANEHVPEKIVEFRQLSSSPVRCSLNDGRPTHPGQLLEIFGGPTETRVSKNPVKSILKPSKYASESGAKPRTSYPSDKSTSLSKKPTIAAVSDVVVERHPGNPADSSDEKPKKMSRFRATRVNK